MSRPSQALLLVSLCLILVGSHAAENNLMVRRLIYLSQLFCFIYFIFILYIVIYYIEYKFIFIYLSAFLWFGVQVAYWGQDSSGTEKSLASYCLDSTYDIIVVGFADVWGTGGDLQINLANQYTPPTSFHLFNFSSFLFSSSVVAMCFQARPC
jgi:hypothetical protein